jgi:hypothetical protein
MTDGPVVCNNRAFPAAFYFRDIRSATVDFNLKSSRRIDNIQKCC